MIILNTDRMNKSIVLEEKTSNESMIMEGGKESKVSLLVLGSNIDEQIKSRELVINHNFMYISIESLETRRGMMARKIE